MKKIEEKNIKKAEIEEEEVINWDQLIREIKENKELYYDKELKAYKYWLGTCYGILPSGKFYTWWCTSNVTEEEIKEDQEFLEKLEKEIEKHNCSLWVDGEDFFVIVPKYLIS